MLNSSIILLFSGNYIGMGVLNNSQNIKNVLPTSKAILDVWL